MLFARCACELSSVLTMCHLSFRGRDVLMKHQTPLHMTHLSIKAFFLSERTAWKAESISAFVVCFFLAKPSNRMRPKMLQHETVGVFVYFISSCGRSGHGGRCQVRSWAYFLALFRLKWIKECLFIIFIFFFVMKYLIPPRLRRD